MESTCKYFARGHCKYGNECKFTHARKYTGGFVRCKPSDLRVVYEDSRLLPVSRLCVQTRDIGAVHNLFCAQNDDSVYFRMLQEFFECGVHPSRLWQHAMNNTHVVADNTTDFKAKCAMLQSILLKLTEFFQMEIKESRVLFYRNDADWKPFHNDSVYAQTDEQYFTVIVSFGSARELCFQDSSKKIIGMPMYHGSTYFYANDVHFRCRNGIPQKHTEIPSDKGTITIVATGFKRQVCV